MLFPTWRKSIYTISTWWNSLWSLALRVCVGNAALRVARCGGSKLFRDLPNFTLQVWISLEKAPWKHPNQHCVMDIHIIWLGITSLQNRRCFNQRNLKVYGNVMKCRTSRKFTLGLFMKSEVVVFDPAKLGWTAEASFSWPNTLPETKSKRP